MVKEPLVYVDGRFVEKSKAVVSVFDHGLLYGDGVFEGIRAYNGSVFRLADHISRLYDSAKVIRLKMPIDEREMTAAVLETMRKNDLRDAYIRLVVTRGAGDLGVDPALCKSPTVFIIAEPMASSLGPREPRVVRMIFSSYRRDAVDATSHEIKSLNYMNSILAKMEASSAGADDAIMLDHRGFVSEASVSNIFIVKDGKLSTPSSGAGILHGITRRRVISLCSDLGLEVAERDITPFELSTADEVFLVGTKSEVLAVGSVGGVDIGTGGVGGVTRKLYGEFSKVVRRAEEGTPVYEPERVRA
ncbi:MAG: branched-chain-amino-acid transaminase [Nitrososphaerota archaeon]|jgi:branched-chain amino acid aminotransferase|nr:branched-chain-amino-acid transaminase [Nitrososphaerota archaeon]MDG6959776.1 branched-chain-amino-acid transaminase [Nitrososphaerota archaeon]MDG6969040.1 branched-chain-amino-acid transaminase [Nitrososphaerota archaeon]MDG6972080.1 branched-chain-amino-acid transaminase [Nitrososphaerota archaeon]MDG6973656.1 branched-chain-amino-acid transaminase [Nitrososphaerota archaeon]